VAGLRGLLNNGNGDVLRSLVAAEQPDLLCLQEHKLQVSHVAECEEQLRKLLGPRYGAFYWAVSLEKKGYSGVVAVLKGPRSSTVAPPPGQAPARQATLEVAGGAASGWGAAGPPLSCRFGLGAANGHSVEGRSVTLEFARFAVTCLYSPNSGEGLKRLDYRLDEWERDLRQHITWLSTKPVLIGGDMNVAFRDEDIWNVGAPHIKKSAGCTPQERAAFAQLCQETGMTDSLVHVHPGCVGAFSYWSQRAGNRPFNRGLRLDYWLVSNSMARAEEAASSPHKAPKLHDAFICGDATPGVSDHAPVGVTLAL
jgi:exodeoxyribonuclease-3/AP endonuclease-1